MYPRAWREAKVIPLHLPLLAQIADQSACYQPLVHFWKKMVSDQIQCYFTVNKLIRVCDRLADQNSLLVCYVASLS